MSDLSVCAGCGTLGYRINVPCVLLLSFSNVELYRLYTTDGGTVFSHIPGYLSSILTRIQDNARNVDIENKNQYRKSKSISGMDFDPARKSQCVLRTLHSLYLILSW
jgi:hypothetical protein